MAKIFYYKFYYLGLAKQIVYAGASQTNKN
jgi:hypothetical protein